jgi:hypothetical protein
MSNFWDLGFRIWDLGFWDCGFGIATPRQKPDTKGE